MRRAAEVEPSAEVVAEVHRCDPCRLLKASVVAAEVDDEFEDDAATEAIKLLEDVQDLFCHLLCQDVKRAVPIPVWNELCHLEARASHLLDSITTSET